MSGRLGNLAEALLHLPWRRLWAAQLEAALADAPPPARGGERWLSTVALLCLLFAASLLIACGYHGGFERLNAFGATYPSWLWAWITSLGDERVAFALALFFSIRAPRLFWTLILAAVIAIAYSRGLKELFDAMRPPAVLPADAFHLIGPGHRSLSFPSGHSVTAGTFFGVLIFHARWIELRALWVLVALLVGFSRIAVGVHWPVDVAFGLAGGALAALLGGWLSTRWPGPARRLGVHMTFVAIALVLAVTLLFDDGGYAEASLMLRVLGAAAIASALLSYVVRPMSRARQGGLDPT